MSRPPEAHGQPWEVVAFWFEWGAESPRGSALKANGEAHWAAPNGGIPPNGSETFVLQVDGMAEAELQQAQINGQWFATSDGERKLTERSQVIQRGGTTATGTALMLPIASIGMFVKPRDFAQRGQRFRLRFTPPTQRACPTASSRPLATARESNSRRTSSSR